MIRTTAQLSKTVAVLAVAMFFSAGASAATVYDNSQFNQNRIFQAPPTPAGSKFEFGDQIFLAGSDRRVTDFQFEYFVSTGASGNETGEIFFYANDGGANNAPGSVLYRSGEFSLDTGFQTVIASALSVQVPNTFTWTVAFSGVDFGEQVGLLVFNPPTVGASFEDFWAKNSDGSWSTFLIDNGATPANFGARVTAVPEPTTFALAALGGLALLGLRRFTRRG